uniref:Uncharacterized protein n=1 Tax=Octactis speculum TaxID=3111310 RepID=A0A7S2C1P0_9STRA
MLDAYKSAVANERATRKKADVLLKKAGHVAMLGEAMFEDYDEQFPGVGGDVQVAFLSQRIEQVASQLKDAEVASAAEAAETASKLESEKESLRVVDTCRDMLKFLSSGNDALKLETQQVLLAD